MDFNAVDWPVKKNKTVIKTRYVLLQIYVFKNGCFQEYISKLTLKFNLLRFLWIYVRVRNGHELPKGNSPCHWDKHPSIRMTRMRGEQDILAWFLPLLCLGMAYTLFLIKSPRDNNYIHEKENNLLEWHTQEKFLHKKRELSRLQPLKDQKALGRMFLLTPSSLSIPTADWHSYQAWAIEGQRI